MKKTPAAIITLLTVTLGYFSQAAPLVNLGLVGVGRLPGNSFDQAGPGQDTLGGIFSGLWMDPATIVHSNGVIHLTAYGLPDRGFGDGLTDYHPRLQRLAITIAPYYGAGPVAQDQITIVNTGTMLFSVNGSPFTGANPDDTNVTTHPQSLATGIGLGKWSLDPEGIVRAADGTWYVSDEYGPFTYHFDALGALQNVLPIPAAYLPKLGPTYPRVNNFLTASTFPTNDSGRYINRGMEGLSITPDGRRLVACLQSPLVQDGENRNPSRNTRILVYDLVPGSVTYQMPIAEYVHVLPLSAAEANNRHTPVSEILAFSEQRFLILQRDSRGLGGDAGPLLYKRIVEVDASNASNILGSGYDLEKGAPGALALPRSGLPSNVVAVTSRDLVDMLNRTQLAKFGLNTAPSNQNINTLSEKWEGLAVVPLNDPLAPNDYLLLIGNDNDFRAPVVYHNGVPVGTNQISSDNMLLAFRIGDDLVPPTIACPNPRTVRAGTNCTALVDLRSSAIVSDNSVPPVTVSQTPSPTTPLGLGTHVITLVATDASGNMSAPCSTTVTVADQSAPLVTGVVPSLRQLFPADKRLVPVTLSVTATDNCSSVLSCEIISVTVNEPPKGPLKEPPGQAIRQPNFAPPDWEITGPLSLDLRAERAGNGMGRFYVITVRCTDEAGNASVGVTSVFVPRSENELAAGFCTSVHPYTLPVGSEYSIVPVLSVGDRVPRTSNGDQLYQMVGIPDGLGAHANKDGTVTLFMNHELVNNVLSESILGEPFSRGAVVSKLILGANGCVISGDLAFHQVYLEDVLLGPSATVSNAMPAFSRLCSGSLAWEEAGFDRPIYFCGEESSGTNTYDGRGGQAIAIFDDAAHILPRLGHLAWENAVTRPAKGPQTAIICLEDGEIGECQLFMYVGTKENSQQASPLRRNGLDNGSLYVFVTQPGGPTNEATFTTGSIQGHWVLLPGTENLTDVQLEAAADAAGAFAFDRIEDGAFRPSDPDEFFFDTTGGSPSNMLGRLYHLRFDRNNLLGPVTLTVVYNADQVIAAGGDIAVSPDNIDVSDEHIMICEDGTAQSRLVMAAKERNGNIWRIHRQTGALQNVAELYSIGRDGIVTNPGVWETSGIIDTSALFGPDSWLFDVQAHSPTRAPAPGTVEDGQLLLMLRNR